MPSVSKSQQRLFLRALAYKRGGAPQAHERVVRLANSMTEEQLKHFTVYNPTYKRTKR